MDPSLKSMPALLWFIVPGRVPTVSACQSAPGNLLAGSYSAGELRSVAMLRLSAQRQRYLGFCTSLGESIWLTSHWCGAYIGRLPRTRTSMWS